MDEITRKAAEAAGLPRFYNPKFRCRKHKHQGEQYTRNGACVTCKVNRDKSGDALGRKHKANSEMRTSLPMPVLDNMKMIDLDGIGLSAVGLENERPLTREEWICLVQVGDRAQSFRKWLIGDLWNQYEWGSKAATMESHGVNPTSAKEYGRVCSRIPVDMRRPNVSFSKHQELCVQAVKNDEHMVMLLDRVEMNNMTVRDIRKLVGSFKERLTEMTGERAPEDQFKSVAALLGKVKKMDVVPSEVLEAAKAFEKVLGEFLQ